MQAALRHASFWVHALPSSQALPSVLAGPVAHVQAKSPVAWHWPVKQFAATALQSIGKPPTQVPLLLQTSPSVQPFASLHATPADAKVATHVALAGPVDWQAPPVQPPPEAKPVQFLIAPARHAPLLHASFSVQPLPSASQVAPSGSATLKQRWLWLPIE